MSVYYEWDIETVDEHDDVLDHDHDDRLALLLKRHGYKLDAGECLVLVFNQGTEADGVTERAWAYVENGKLPNMFDNGQAIPQRFRKELARFLS